MKVILRSDITNVGRQGDVKVVADGYARNYLLPRRLAMEASPANLKLWEKEKVKLEKQRDQIISDARAVADKIEKTSFTITVKVGENNRLFGSVTNAALARILADNGFTVDKHNILLPEPIKEVGAYTVDIRLHPEVIAKAKIWIVAEKGKEEETPAEETAAAEPAPAEETPEAKEEAKEETKEETKE
jgi:large subunit ribosomal protein L9